MDCSSRTTLQKRCPQRRQRDARLLAARARSAAMSFTERKERDRERERIDSNSRSLMDQRRYDDRPRYSDRDDRERYSDHRSGGDGPSRFAEEGRPQIRDDFHDRRRDEFDDRRRDDRRDDYRSSSGGYQGNRERDFNEPWSNRPKIPSDPFRLDKKREDASQVLVVDPRSGAGPPRPKHLPPTIDDKVGDWQCAACGNWNWARRKSCNMCNAAQGGLMSVKGAEGGTTRSGLGGGFSERDEAEEARRQRRAMEERQEKAERKAEKKKCDYCKRFSCIC